MKISSQAFKGGGLIPARYTCDGENAQPALQFSEVPESAVSLVLIVDDPDAPGGTFVHWLVWNIPAGTKAIPENINLAKILPQARQGITSFGKSGWGGPCPPSGTHRYRFKAYALDAKLQLATSAEVGELEKAMTGRVLDKAQLVGLYRRQARSETDNKN